MESHNQTPTTKEGEPTTARDLLLEDITKADKTSLETPKGISIFFGNYVVSLIERGICGNFEQALNVARNEIPRALEIIGSQELNKKYVEMWRETLRLGDQGQNN